MNVVSRGIRNAFRNQIRTLSIVVILSISIGLALAMLVARQAVESKIATVKSSIGNTISVSPAGARGFEGGGEPLTTAELDKVKTLAHVVGITETLSDRLTTSDTNLQSAIDAGSLGRRFGDNSGVGFQAPPDDGGIGRSSASDGSNSQDTTSGTSGDSSSVMRTFTPPVTVTGTTDMTSASSYGGTSVKFTSGAALDATKDENKAVIGSALATKNNLKVGSTFTAYGTDITVAGIYDAGNTFANGGVIMTLASLQRLSSQSGDISSAVVKVDSIDNLSSTTSAVSKALGSAADVVSSQDTANAAVEPLESVKTISLYSLIGAVLAGALIILLTMIMIVRERRREIGVMKAIGASNMSVMFQFMSEAVTLTVLSLVVGLIIGIAAASPLTHVLVTNSASSSQSVAGPGAGAFGTGSTTRSARTGFGAARGLRQIGGNSLASVRTVKADVGPAILGYGVLAALIIAIVGSAIPAFLISKIRPAEVMRAD